MYKVRRPVDPIHKPRALIRQLVRPRQKRRLLPHEHMPATTPTHGLPNKGNNNLFTLEVNLGDQVYSSSACPGFVVDGQAETAPAFEGGTDEPVLGKLKWEREGPVC